MHFYRCIIFALIFMSLVGCANNKMPPPGQFPDETFLHDLPSGWKQAFSTRKGNMGMKEFVPKEQSAENWKEMITTQIFFGGIGKSAEQFAEEMKISWRAACPKANVYPGRSGNENGYRFVFWKQFCGNNPQTNKPEFTLLKAIEGNDSFYVIQKSWKRPPNREEMVSWAKFLRRATVCDSRIPERKCPKWLNHK